MFVISDAHLSKLSALCHNYNIVITISKQEFVVFRRQNDQGKINAKDSIYDPLYAEVVGRKMRISGTEVWFGH